MLIVIKVISDGGRYSIAGSTFQTGTPYLLATKVI